MESSLEEKYYSDEKLDFKLTNFSNASTKYPHANYERCFNSVKFNGRYFISFHMFLWFFCARATIIFLIYPGNCVCFAAANTCKMWKINQDSSLLLFFPAFFLKCSALPLGVVFFRDFFSKEELWEETNGFKPFYVFSSSHYKLLLFNLKKRKKKNGFRGFYFVRFAQSCLQNSFLKNKRKSNIFFTKGNAR